MKQSMSRIAVISVAAVLLGLGGCATTKSVDKLKERVANLEAQSSDTAATASRAETSADEAKVLAQEANDMAEEAGVCCVRNTERLDRMFEKSQRK